MEPGFEPVDLDLRNGRTVHVRAIVPSDEEELLQAFDLLSGEARYMRFMHAIREPNRQRLRAVLATMPERGLAIAATVSAQDGIDIVGTATFMIAPDRRTCEFAISVADAWAGAGLGSALMRLLIDSARRRGLREMEGFVLAENAAMLRLASRLGFRTSRHPDDYGVRVCRLALEEGESVAPTQP
jgi:acetyltransferase